MIRETLGSSVGPTASVSMLKPRREKSPATRASTPGLFSTWIERMCLRPLSCPGTSQVLESHQIGGPGLHQRSTNPGASTMSRAGLPGAIIG